jgi:hypothetical protein
MAQGFTLISDPDVTQYRRVKIATPSAGTMIISGTPVDQSHTASATVDVAVSTASSVTSAIYGVTVETIYAGQTSVLIAIITPRQFWAAEVSTSTTSATGTASTSYNNLRSILGYQTVTVGTTALPQGALNYLSSTGVQSVPAATTANLVTVYNSTSDVTGTTGVFEQLGTLPSVSTTRIVGRFLVEHAA